MEPLYYRCPICSMKRSAAFVYRRFKCKGCGAVLRVVQGSFLLDLCLIGPPWFLLVWWLQDLLAKNAFGERGALYLSTLGATLILLPFYFAIRPWFDGIQVEGRTPR